MVARTLVTTADERTWPKDKNEPVLFLGEWCMRYSRKHIWQGMDYEVVPYHWDNRKKLHTDYIYLDNLYEKLLRKAVIIMNSIHSTHYPIRYWRILIGPWLKCFLHILFDRWFMLKSAIDQFDIKECNIINNDDNWPITIKDTKGLSIFVDDNGNEALYSKLLSILWGKNITLHSINKDLNDNIKTSYIQRQNNRLNLKEILKKALLFFGKYVSGNQKFFFYSSYIPAKYEFLLQIYLLQIPVPRWTEDVFDVLPNKKYRKWKLDDCHLDKDIFDTILGEFIALCIPTCYIEGYSKLDCLAQSKNWPNNPKVIFTSNAYHSDEVFKIWTARKIYDCNTSLFIGQHGGLFGVNRFYADEDHQVSIADKWLSWGWSDKKRHNIVPFYAMNLSGKKWTYDPSGGALLVQYGDSRYSYYLHSGTVSRQLLDYFSDQQRFLEGLPKNIRKETVLRLYPAKDLGWDQLERWRNKIPGVEINSDGKDIKGLVQKSRLYIATYNATNYLESLYFNMPTIIFWNPEHWELNKDAEPYFKLLESVGIFHSTPESAARQTEKIWSNVDSWWHSNEVQEARKKFCYKYARSSSNFAVKLKPLLKGR